MLLMRFFYFTALTGMISAGP